uniref:Huntingtin interacting protein 1 related n=1 Tax=Cyclopterus lumpus TaxID=8103 RepID=A0A8C3G3Y1_CYCLU
MRSLYLSRVFLLSASQHQQNSDASETPPKEKHRAFVRPCFFLDRCDVIIVGTHKEGGASTFWSYALNLPLSSSSITSWKFCYLLHKVLRDGHRNVNSHRYCRNVKDMGVLWVSNRCQALMNSAAGLFNFVLDCVCVFLILFFLREVLRQLDANGAKATTAAGLCRLTPLIPLILDCSFLYHFSVLLMFKLHGRLAPDVLLGHRERFRDLFTSLAQFFDRAREMEFFKSIIQIPDLPDAPPNFLRAAALGEYKKPVVLMANEGRHTEEEVETHPEVREASPMPQVQQNMNKYEFNMNLILKRELEVLRPELQLLKAEAQRCVTELRAQVDHLEAEVEEQRGHKQVAMLEKEHLRTEVEALRSANAANAGAQIGFREADRESWTPPGRSCTARPAPCRAKSWWDTVWRSFRPEGGGEHPLTGVCDPQSGTQLSSSLAGLQAEREALLRSARDQEAELNSLRQQACRGEELSQKLKEEQFCLLQCAVVEAEGIILDAVAKLDDPVHVLCTSSPDYLVNRAEITLSAIDKMQQSHVVYLGNTDDASGLLRAVTQFSHLTADTIVNGSAASHSAPTDQADRLTDSCRDCANHCLQYLKDLKLQATLPRADPSAVRFTVQRILALGQDLRPKGRDVLKEELGAMVDKEMIATATAIEEAVLRMDEILNQTRRETSGVQLEVNQSILGSCSDLMKAVHMLVTASTDLQKDIVEGGRGAASVTDFYAKNSRWTEGLISASKAVGWGATQLLDSADRVVGEDGAYEELIACSHEIAASTAHLVAASKVKADRGNKKLQTLKQASRHVNDMAALVVTSTKHGQLQISDQGAMDFSGMSLIKLKTEEMEAQVKVLQLESQLDQGRVRLGELRKRHYELDASGAGNAAGDAAGDAETPDVPAPPHLCGGDPRCP